ncbi:MAG: hypothetical protein LIR50_07800 [Bacillota bacterium]|nr:hypothetical protein [Bacillota bacterium]
MTMINENQEKERASNIIWNASADYSFDPKFRAYDESGEADLYLNYIIGAVHKYYDYSLLDNYIRDLHHDFLENLMWIGLENCTYAKSKDERPVLETLRRSYSEKILSICSKASADHILNKVETAHYMRALGIDPQIKGSVLNILNDLEFDESMNTEQIILRMNKIIRNYFGYNYIPAKYKNKKELHNHDMPSVRLMNVYYARLLSKVKFKKKKHKLKNFILGFHKFIELKGTYKREYIQDCYGASIMPKLQIKALEQTLCYGNHKYCHLHVTRGEFGSDVSINKDALNRKKAALMQRDKNKEHYQENFTKYSNSISKLTNRIRNTKLFNLDSCSRSEAGKLAAGKIWRNIYLNDSKIFFKNLKDDIGDLSVDIMLDASSSQTNRQEIIAAEAYIIAESLTRCRIPVKVYSFCTERTYTVINLYRDYEENNKNDKIFNYFSAGSNRDGLAIRTALHMMKDSPCENKILIILSDGVPNDTQGISGGRFNQIHYEYIDAPGVNDTAFEVRKGLREGVSILCVYTGLDEDVADAKKIYGHNLARIKSQERFADVVGIMIQNELK